MTNKEAIHIIQTRLNTYYCTDEDLEALDLAIKALEERPKGKWTDGECECPCCGEDKFKDLDADIWADWRPNFCPNCGADMRGDV